MVLLIGLVNATLQGNYTLDGDGTAGDNAFWDWPFTETGGGNGTDFCEVFTDGRPGNLGYCDDDAGDCLVNASFQLPQTFTLSFGLKVGAGAFGGGILGGSPVHWTEYYRFLQQGADPNDYYSFQFVAGGTTCHVYNAVGGGSGCLVSPYETSVFFIMLDDVTQNMSLWRHTNASGSNLTWCSSIPCTKDGADMSAGDLEIGDWDSCGGDMATGVVIDEFKVWDTTLNVEQMHREANWVLHGLSDVPAGAGGGGGLDVNITYPLEDKLFIENDLVIHDHNIWVNITTNQSGAWCNMFDTNFTINRNLTGSNQFEYKNNTYLPEINYTVYVECNYTTTNGGKDDVSFEIDLTMPLITVTHANFFNVSNNSIISNYTSPTAQLNITVFDLNLYKSRVNITNSTGDLLFSHFITASTATTNNHYYLIGINSTYSLGNYTAMTEGSDNHTAKEIDEYGTTVKNNLFQKYINYKTAEENDITIKPLTSGVTDIKTSKHKDRYDFEFTYNKDKDAQEYLITSINKMEYLGNSEYTAHFIIYSNGLNGNWIDFEADGLTKGDVTVTKITDYQYKVTINKKMKKVKFKSIGGLNYNRVDYNFIVGGTVEMHGFAGSISDGMNFTVVLNGSSVNHNFTTNNGTFIFSALEKGTYDVTVYPSLTNWSVITGTVNVTDNYDNISYIFSRSNSITITIRDETDDTLITETIKIYVAGSTGTYVDSTVTGSYFIYNLPAEIYKVSLGNANYTYRDFYVNVFDTLGSTLTAYLLKTSDGQQVIFNIQESGTTANIENAFTSFYRKFNLTYFLVNQKYSDFAGQVVTQLDPAIEYRILLNHSDYDDRLIDLTPALTSYTIFLEGYINVSEVMDYDRIALYYRPSTYYNNKTQPFDLTISSPYNHLTGYGYTLTYPGGTVTNTGVNTAGEVLTSIITINGANYYDRVKIDYWYNSDISGVRNFTKYHSIIMDEDNTTMIGNRQNTYGLGLFERLLIAVFTVILIVGVATLVGQALPGLALGMGIYGYLVYIGFIPLWSVLISVTLALIIVGSNPEG